MSNESHENELFTEVTANKSTAFVWYSIVQWLCAFAQMT